VASPILFSGLHSHAPQDELVNSKLFDPRLAKIVLKVVDVSYGMQQGLQQAIAVAADALSGAGLVQQQALLQQFMEEVARDRPEGPLYCYGAQQTMLALEAGAIQELLIWEKCETTRHTFVMPNGGTSAVLHRLLDQCDSRRSDDSYFT
jgi:peptide chain release factor subunit 1